MASLPVSTLTANLNAAITDPLNRQNSAARVRGINQDIIDSSINKVDMSGGTLSALLYLSGGTPLTTVITNIVTAIGTSGLTTTIPPTQIAFGSALSGITGSSNFTLTKTVNDSDLNINGSTSSNLYMYVGAGGMAINAGPLDTYFTLYTNSSFIFRPNFAEKARLNSTGLGIGKSPAYPLDVAGRTNTDSLSATSISASTTLINRETIKTSLGLDFLTGTTATTRMVEVDYLGAVASPSEIYDAWLVAGTTAALALENVANWSATNYIGAAITGTYKGQQHSDTTYLFVATDDNVWRRVTFT